MGRTSSQALPESQTDLPRLKEWVQEAADQAAAKGSKAADTYGKAARSIRNHKEKLDHPSQAQALQWVGPKIVEMITRRLQQWCKDNYEQFPLQGAPQLCMRGPQS